MTREHYLSMLGNKVETAIKWLQQFEPPEGYYLAFSGGKDSITVKKLTDLAGVKYRAVYNVTSVDPPELIQYICKHHPDVEFDKPRDENGKQITMWSLIAQKKMPPTRRMRYCCKSLKEAGGNGMLCVTGVRWAESTNRAKNAGAVLVRDGKGLGDNANFRKPQRGE